jgi:hypothetical protein
VQVSEVADEIARAALLRLCDVLPKRTGLLESVEEAAVAQ